MAGIWEGMTPEQQQAAIDYRGPENHGGDADIMSAIAHMLAASEAMERDACFHREQAIKHHEWGTSLVDHAKKLRDAASVLRATQEQEPCDIATDDKRTVTE